MIVRDKIRVFWHARQPSEKVWLAGGALVVLAMLFYVYLLMPVQAERKRLANNMPQLRASAAALTQNAAEVKRLQATPSVLSAKDVRQQITETSRAGGIADKISEIVIVNPQRARVILNAVPFDALIRWLNHLQTQAGLRVESLELNALAQPGQVAVDVTLQAAR